jgi:hypothetical protein
LVDLFVVDDEVRVGQFPPVHVAELLFEFGVRRKDLEVLKELLFGFEVEGLQGSCSNFWRGLSLNPLINCWLLHLGLMTVGGVVELSGEYGHLVWWVP